MPQTKKPMQQRLEKYLDQIMGAELERARKRLVVELLRPNIKLLTYAEQVIAFWRESLLVDRIFICNMKDGEILAGWNKGKNIIKLSDWDSHYVPLEDDRTLQEALESDGLVASPVDGEGADLAFSIRFGKKGLWLVAFDQTDTARYFSHMDMALIRLGSDLMRIKAQMSD